mgnify:CR=1 FL=1
MTRPAPLSRLQLQPLALAATHWTLDSQREMFDLNPPYQRGSVWTLGQRQRLIESLIRRIPVGSVVYNVRKSFIGGGGKFYAAVIDGKQRVEAVRAFFDDEFSVPAWWFEDDELDVPADGEVTYSGLSDVGRRRAMMWSLPGLEAHVDSIEEEARLFDLLNSGGTAQTDDDLARARAVAGIEHVPAGPQEVFIVQNDIGDVVDVFADPDDASDAYQFTDSGALYSIIKDTVWRPGEYARAQQAVTD